MLGPPPPFTFQLQSYIIFTITNCLYLCFRKHKEAIWFCFKIHIDISQIKLVYTCNICYSRRTNMTLLICFLVYTCQFNQICFLLLLMQYPEQCCGPSLHTDAKLVVRHIGITHWWVWVRPRLYKSIIIRNISTIQK